MIAAATTASSGAAHRYEYRALSAARSTTDAQLQAGDLLELFGHREDECARLTRERLRRISTSELVQQAPAELVVMALVGLNRLLVEACRRIVVLRPAEADELR